VLEAAKVIEAAGARVLKIVATIASPRRGRGENVEQAGYDVRVPVPRRRDLGVS
jgi:hypothetical protein